MNVWIVVAAMLFAGALVAAPQDEIPQSYRKMKNPLKPSQELLSSARETYERTCVFCHGSAGKGDGEKMMVAEGRQRPNFTSRAFLKRSDQWIIWRISEGVASTRMMGYKDEFSEKDRWSLVLLVRSFNPKTPKPGSKK